MQQKYIRTKAASIKLIAIPLQWMWNTWQLLKKLKGRCSTPGGGGGGAAMTSTGGNWLRSWGTHVVDYILGFTSWCALIKVYWDHTVDHEAVGLFLHLTISLLFAPQGSSLPPPPLQLKYSEDVPSAAGWRHLQGRGSFLFVFIYSLIF